MPRPKFYGFCAVLFSVLAGGFFFYKLFDAANNSAGSYALVDMHLLDQGAYYTLAFPIALVTLFVIVTGFWIGWTILSIKVVPPMPELVEKKDYSKIKAFFLCLFTLGLAVLLLYGIHIRSFWALAVPAAVITLVILGAIFWVGIAILTTRNTLPEKK